MGFSFDVVRCLAAIMWISIYLMASPAFSAGKCRVTIPFGGKENLAAWYFLPDKSGNEPIPGVLVAANVGGLDLIQYHTYCDKLADRNFAVLLIDASNFPQIFPPEPDSWRKMPQHIWAWCHHILVAVRLGFGHEWYLRNIDAGVSHLCSSSRVDANRIAVSGFSQSANAALTHACCDPRVKAVVWNNGGWPWILPYDPAKLPPVLIFHGEKDGVYDVNYARKLAAEMEKAGLDHECYIYPNQRHMFNVYYELEKAGDFQNPVLVSTFERLIRFLGRVLSVSAKAPSHAHHSVRGLE